MRRTRWSLWQLSLAGLKKDNFSSWCWRMSQKPWLICFLKLQSTWMQKMCLLPKRMKKVKGREKTQKMPDLTLERGPPSSKGGRMTGGQGLPLDESLTSPPWTHPWIRCWCKLETTLSSNGQKSWRETRTSDPGISTAASIVITDTIPLTTMS